MGCTTSQPQNNQLNEPQFMDDTGIIKKDPDVFAAVEVGLILLCKDEFVSKYTGENMFRWRSSEIKIVEGDDCSRILIHYIGWSETFDFWLDLHNEWTKVAPAQLLSKQQCDQGVLLNEEQERCTLHFLKTGEFRRDLPPPTTHSSTIKTGVDSTIQSNGSDSLTSADQNSIRNSLNDKNQPVLKHTPSWSEQSPTSKGNNGKGGLFPSSNSGSEKKSSSAIPVPTTPTASSTATAITFPQPSAPLENPALISPLQFAVGQQVQ